jgi:uncharacterized protein YegP (UPF0339 family)
MAGFYTLTQNAQGQFTFALHAANGELILRSEQYESKDAAERGIASVQRNSLLDERYVREQAADGRHYFNLTAGNHQVIGTSQMYSSAPARDGGIASVMLNGSTTAGTSGA